MENENEKKQKEHTEKIKAREEEIKAQYTVTKVFTWFKEARD